MTARTLSARRRRCLRARRPDATNDRRFKGLDLRFSAPVYPGETIRTEMWRDDNVVSFRARVVERDIVVLNNGRAEIA